MNSQEPQKEDVLKLLTEAGFKAESHRFGLFNSNAGFNSLGVLGVGLMSKSKRFSINTFPGISFWLRSQSLSFLRVSERASALVFPCFPIQRLRRASARWQNFS